MVELTLSLQEKQIIKSIARLQLDSYNRLLNGDTSIDITLEVSRIGIELPDLTDAYLQCRQEWQDIYNNPETAFTTSPDNLELLQDIMLNFEQDFRKEYGDGVGKLFHKFKLYEFISEHIN
jgi:hypothetical protein